MVLSWLEQDKTWTSVHACDTRSSKVSVHQTRFVRMEHGDVYLETSMSGRTTSESNSSNTSCTRARDKVRRRLRLIRTSIHILYTLNSDTVEHNREHPQELLLRVLQRTKPCGTISITRDDSEVRSPQQHWSHSFRKVRWRREPTYGGKDFRNGDLWTRYENSQQVLQKPSTLWINKMRERENVN